MNVKKPYRFLNPLVASSLFIVPMLVASQASAFQLTYTSDALPFIQGYLGGEPDDSVGTYDPPTPIFSAVFDTTGSGLTYSFSSANVQVDSPYAASFTATPGADSSITFNSDGSIASWNFLVTFTQYFEEIPFVQPENYQTWTMTSSYGAGTCNCDTHWTQFDIFTQRQHTWSYVNTIRVLYGGDSATDNWSYESASVPEPFSAALFLTGMGLLGAARLRKKV